MDIGAAINHLRHGRKVHRTGWNGKGMYLFFIPGTTVSADNSPIPHITGPDVEATFLPMISMHTVERALVPWTASQTDLLANDWQVLPSGRIVTPPKLVTEH